MSAYHVRGPTAVSTLCTAILDPSDNLRSVHASRAAPSTYILVLSDRKKREKDRSRSGIRLLYLSRVNRKRDSLFPPGRLAVLLARQKNGGFVMELDPEKRSGPRKYNRAKHPNPSLERENVDRNSRPSFSDRRLSEQRETTVRGRDDGQPASQPGRASGLFVTGQSLSDRQGSKGGR